MFDFLLQAAANPGVKVDPGWSWTTTVNAVQTVIISLIGGGGLYGLFKGVALLWKMYNESKALDAQGAAAVRKEMMDLNDRQIKRIETLEDDVRDERKRCDEEVAALRKSHAEEVANMRLAHAEEMREMGKRMDALHAQMVQMQRSTGSVIRTAGKAPTATARMLQDESDAAGIGEFLRRAHDLPPTGDDV